MKSPIDGAITTTKPTKSSSVITKQAACKRHNAQTL